MIKDTFLNQRFLVCLGFFGFLTDFFETWSARGNLDVRPGMLKAV